MNTCCCEFEEEGILFRYSFVDLGTVHLSRPTYLVLLGFSGDLDESLPEQTALQLASDRLRCFRKMRTMAPRVQCGSSQQSGGR